MFHTMSCNKGGRLLPSHVSRYPSGRPKPPETGPRVPPKTTQNWPVVHLVARDPFGRPRPRPFVMDLIKAMKRLHPDEKVNFGYIFSQLLGLPQPPPLPGKDTGDKFAVKLLEFDPEKRWRVLGAVAWAKCNNVKVLKSLSELGLSPSLVCVQNVPNSLIKQGVTKEEATEIITSIEAAGGVAVMEPCSSHPDDDQLS